MSEFQSPTQDPRWSAKNRNIKAEQIAHVLENFARVNLKESNVLDFGCGSGGIAAHLAARVNTMTGLDPEPWPRWNQWLEQHNNLSFIQGSVDRNTLSPQSFDVIICNQVYEHVPDPEALIGLIAKLVKPDGVVYFAGPNLLFPIEPHVFWPFVHWLPRRFAIKLMKTLGSKHAESLDAYSTHYWKLKSWLDAHFESENALPFLIKKTLPDMRKRRTLTSMIPKIFLKFMTPALPGFIFILRLKNIH